jgi:hypothetical protein
VLSLENNNCDYPARQNALRIAFFQVFSGI